MKEFLKEYFRLIKFASGSKGLLFLAALCMGVSTIFDGISLGMIIPLSDRIMTNKAIIIPDKLHLSAFLMNIIDKLNNTEPLVLLKIVVIFMIFLFFFKGIFFFLQNYLMNVVGQSVIREVRNRLYAQFNRLSLEFYARKRTGELISRITNDVGFITQAISYALTDCIYNSMQIVLYTIMGIAIAVSISWKLPIIIFIIFPLIGFPVLKIGKRIKKLSGEIQNKMADLNSLLAETIQGVYIVKVFCREKYEEERFKNINHQYYKYTLKSLKRTLMLSPFTEFVGVLGAVIVLTVVGKEVIFGNLSFGVFGLFLGSLMSIIKPIKKLSNVHAINQQAIAASTRIYNVLDEEVKIKSKNNAIKMTEFKEQICFDKVVFRYNEEEDVLKDINLQIKRGETIALVGPSGAGKSTLVSLIPRLYDSQEGVVSIDGVNVKDCRVKSLRQMIAVVSQEMVLFHATVRDNIAYGREGATENEIIEAAKKAYAYGFIKNLPGGFDTIIGDRGFRLSGGERQRIALARAILKEAPILILDEATSQLDSESEQLIEETVYRLMEEKTVIVIAHRLSTVQRANRIVVMENGKIVEIGKHAVLLESNTLYKKLYEMQFRG
ncbi:MAG: ABC transporter ATP-binding protein [Candidatus Omnitrophota bacterium]|nr:ABC transporter ATP-binding protein/permease [Candidatus Omnitrophota bacterium]